MKTKVVMAASAVFMGALGLAATFLPKEFARYLVASPIPALPLLIQLTGALYFAFALLNWTAKDSLIGGIYNRPVAIGNLVHFVVGALALVKGAPMTKAILPLTIIYAIFAIAFGLIFFRSPVQST